jgi:hypothetical protein
MPASADPQSTLASGRAAAFSLVAALAHLAIDALSSRWPWTTPPHLQLAYAPEVVREMLSPLAVGIAASAVNGVIAGIALLAVEPWAGPAPGRRTLRLGVVLFGFWLLSDGLLALVWLSAPWSLVLGGLAAGLPRSLAVGWLLARLARPAKRAGAAG